MAAFAPSSQAETDPNRSVGIQIISKPLRDTLHPFVDPQCAKPMPMLCGVSNHLSTAHATRQCAVQTCQTYGYKCANTKSEDINREVEERVRICHLSWFVDVDCRGLEKSVIAVDSFGGGNELSRGCGTRTSVPKTPETNGC